MPVNIEHPVIDGLGLRMQALRFPTENDLIIEFGEWMPDRTDLGNPGGLEALNVIPDIDGYRPQADIATISDAADALVQGGVGAISEGGHANIYVGNKTKLYRMDGSTLTDASKSGGYATAADGHWEFTQFGSEILATNEVDAIQKSNVGTGSTFADAFTSTLKPKAKTIATLRDQILLGDTTDGTDGHVPNRVWFGAQASSVDFDPDATTQCDIQDIQDAGHVQRVIGGAEYGLVFCASAIERMDYVGSPLVYEFNRIDRKRGTHVPNSVIGFGRYVFFWTPEGIFVTNGVESVPIGHDKVDRWLLDQFDPTNLSVVSTAVDPLNKIIAWSFPGTGASGTTPNTILYFNWATKRFSYTTGITHTRLIDSFTRGHTLDELDAAFGTDIDDSAVYPYSFDSPSFAGGQREIQAMSSDHKIARFTGSNLAATLDTGEKQMFPGYVARTTKIRPIVETGGSSATLTCAAAGRQRQNDTVTFDTATSQVTDGFCPSNNSSRYHRFRTVIAAASTWSRAQGVVVKSVKEGTL